jgi:hypothetical protein
MLILLLGEELFLADRRTDRQMRDRQTDMTKLIIALQEFVNTPKDICKNR